MEEGVSLAMFLTKRWETGYIGTVYLIPPGLNGHVPLSDLTVVSRGLYDDNGTLIDELPLED